MSIKIKKIISFVFPLLVIGLFLVPVLVSAQASLGLEVAGDTGLGTTDLKELIVRIVQILLGFLGVIAVIIMLYGGYIWMTAGGNADKVSTAQKILINGVIGLVVILSAFSVVTYIINQMNEVGEPGINEICEPVGLIEGCNNIGDCERERECGVSGYWGGCYITNLPCDQNYDPAGSFSPQNIQPQGNLRIKNVVVQVTFNRDVDEVGVDDRQQGIRVSKLLDDGNYELVEGTLEYVNNRLVTFTPEAVCEEDENYKCFEGDKEYRVVVSDTEEVSILSISGQTVNCSFADCEADFSTGNLVDVTDPDPVDLTRVVGNPNTNLYNGVNLSATELYDLYARAVDDSGVTQINFYVEGGFLDSVTPPDVPLEDFEGFVYWNTDSYPTNQTVTLGATAYDGAFNQTSAPDIEVMLRFPECFNGRIDSGAPSFETGLDCGGECPICEGESCSIDINICEPNNNACLSNVCDENTCFCVPLPVITSVDPDDGAIGNWVTIFGQNFGDEPGTIIFTDPEINILLAYPPEIEGCEAEATWQDNQIIVEVPEGAEGVGNSTWRILTAQMLSSNLYEDFILDPNAVYPGVCSITPDQGLFETEFTIIGTNFGEGDERSVYFGDQPGENLATNPEWSAGAVTAQVPNLQTGQSPVRVQVGENSSNGIFFTVLGDEEDPLNIDYFDPTEGGHNQYVTIYGSGFGSTKTDARTVTFEAYDGDSELIELPGNFEFPGACGTNYWTNDTIIVKVPFMDHPIEDGGRIFVYNDGESVNSGDNLFTFTNADATPGICSINPEIGEPNVTVVEIAGEPFTNATVNFSNVSGLQPEEGSDNNRIVITVPDIANSGQITVESDQGIESNSINFEVIGALAPPIGENDDIYQWQFTTCWDCLVPEVMERGNCFGGNASPLPLRYPWNGYNTAFIDQDFGVQFNVDMDNDLFEYPNIIFKNCGQLVNFNEGNCTDGSWPAGDITFTDTSPEYVTFNPTNNLSPDTWYQITLTTGLSSIFENPDTREIERVYLEDDYKWHFKTQKDDGLCEADRVTINPANRTSGSNVGPIPRYQNVNYNSYGVNSGNCAICPDNFVWDWTSSHENDAQIDSNIHSSSNPVYASNLIQDPDEAVISASITNAPPNPTGEAHLNIVPPDPHIVMDSSCSNGSDRSPTPWPNEEKVCTNIMIYARFNVMMDADTLTTSNVRLYSCDEGGCNTFVQELDNKIVPDDVDEIDYFIYTPSTSLTALDSWYEIRLSQDILSTDEVPLTGMRSWRFKTKNDETWCQINRISVLPNLNNLAVEEEYEYVANGSDSVTCQLLKVEDDTVWNWSSEFNRNAIPTSYDNAGSSVVSVSPNSNNGGQGETNATANIPGVTYLRSYIEFDDYYIYNTGYNGRVTVGTPQVLTLEDFMPTGDEVCLNALVRTEFNNSLDEIIISSSNFSVWEDNNQVSTLISNNNSRQIVSLRSSESTYLWEPNKTYSVIISGGDSGIRSGNLTLEEEGCLAEWNSEEGTCYWEFTTNEEMCEAESVIVTPTSTTNFIDDEVNWEAIAYDKFERALSNPVNFWSLTKENIAFLTIAPPNNATTQSIASGSTWVEATISNLPNGGQLIVEPEETGPSVRGIEPDNLVSNVCRNALVSVEFDKYLDEQTVNDEVFTVSYHSENMPVINDSILTFDGDDDYITIEAEEATELNMADNDFMAEAWIKTTDSDQGIIFEKFGNTGWWFGVNDRHLMARLSAPQGENNTDRSISSQTTINDDLWHHVVLTADRDGLAQLYIDGVVEDITTMISDVGSLENDNNANIGKFSNGDGALDGSLASVRLYKFTNGIPINIGNLIQQQYEHPLSVENRLSNSMIANWKINEGTGTNVSDSSTYNHTLSQETNGQMPIWEKDNLPVAGSCEQIVLNDSNFQKGNNLIFRTFIAKFINNLMPDLFGNLVDRFFNKTYAQEARHLVISVPQTGFWCPMDSYGDWAVSNISGTAKTNFQLSTALPEYKIIRVKVLGGEDGVKSVNGENLENPNLDSDYVIYFGTSEDICELDFVVVDADQVTGDNEWLFRTSSDDDSDNEYGLGTYDASPDFDKVFQATGYSSTPRGSQALTSIAGVYEWDWQWNSEDTSIALTADCEVFDTYYPNCETFNNNSSVVLAANNNGETNITAQAVFPPWYNKINLSDSGIAKVELCENPWPSYDQNNELRYYDENEKDEGYKFALSYCRDAGGYGTMDDLPSIYEGDDLSQVTANGWFFEEFDEISATDGTEDDLLVEYLIPVPATEDILGIRIYSNYYHLSPQNWYSKNIPSSQQGSLNSFAVDGYQAIQDGRTVYVAGTTLGLTGVEVSEVYTNIFLISYNSGAAQETIDIFDRIVERLEFNTNISDSEFKATINRDLQRMTDLSDVEKSLYEYSLNNQERIINNDFEQGLTAWEIEGDPQEVVVNTDSTKVRHGSKSIHVIAKAGGEGIYQTLLLDYSTNYDMSTWVFVKTGQVHLTFSGNNDPADHWFSPPDFTGWIKLNNVLQIYDIGQSGWANSPNNGIYIRSHNGPAEFYADSVILRSNYPNLSAGSFLPGMSTSRWPSWSQTLGPTLGGSLPTDPINNFNGCVACEADLDNGGFEFGLFSWDEVGTANIVINEDINFIKTGSKSLYINNFQNESGGVTQEASLAVNTLYNLSAWVYVTSGQVEFKYDDDSTVSTPGREGWIKLLLEVDTHISPTTALVSVFAHSTQEATYFTLDDIIITPQDATCGYDSETCWNPQANNEQGAFACDAASHFYRYQYRLDNNPNSLTFGTPSYFVSAKMEMPYANDVADTWLPQNRDGYIFFNTDNLLLSPDMVEGCDQSVIGQECGNGTVEPPVEECEPGEHHNWCPVGYNWEDPQIYGCNPVNNANECKWITPDGVYPDYCGGYCGDGAVADPEGCDPSASIGSQGFGGGTGVDDQYDCSVVCQDIGGYCGNNIVNINYGEECDGDYGLGVWDCDNNEDPTCDNCSVSCPNNGNPYTGSCGNGTIEEGEECDDDLGPPNVECSNSCHITRCIPPWSACDGDWADEDGCEINLEADPENCLTCGTSCYEGLEFSDYTIVACEDGCAFACDPYNTYLNCYNPPADCETNYNTDAENCSYCGHSCYDDVSRISNRSLENNNLGPWEIIGEVSSNTRSDVQIHHRNYSRYIEADADGAGIYQVVAFEPSNTYNLSAWVYVVSGQVRLTFNGDDDPAGNWISPEDFTGWIKLENILNTHNGEQGLLWNGLGNWYNSPTNEVHIVAHRGSATFYVDEVDGAVSNHTAFGCSFGDCSYSCSEPPWTDCSDELIDCESNIQIDPDDCNECGRQCPEPNELNTEANRDMVAGYGLDFALPANYGTASCGGGDCSMEWHCERYAQDAPGNMDVVSWGYEDNNLNNFVIEDTTIGGLPATLHTGETAGGISLPPCRLSGTLMVDLEIDAAGAVGIIFVSDKSGSMAGAGMSALKTAIAGANNALDSIQRINPSAQVALISYNSSPSLDQDFIVMNDENVVSLKQTVESYSPSSQTNHVDALNLAATTFNNANNFNTQIVIFMTDGGTPSVQAMNARNDLINNGPNGTDIFTVGLIGNLHQDAGKSLASFMNGLSYNTEQSPNQCICAGGACTEQQPSTQCGDNNAQCWNGDDEFEECDGQENCNNECQWNEEYNYLNRAYATTNPGNLREMYQAIAGAIPVSDITLQFNGVSIGDVEPNEDNQHLDFMINLEENGGQGYHPIITCPNDDSPRGGNSIYIEFDGGDEATIEITNPRYYYCPWSHNDFVSSNENYQGVDQP